MNQVVMLGAFPPPAGGAARNNAILYESLRSAGANVRRIDVSASTLNHSRDVKFHFERIGRNLTALAAVLALRSRERTLYLVPDGGAGAWYSLAHVRAAGSGYSRVILHHHTYRYINRHRRPMDLIARALPANATHVFLSEGMADRFQRRYGPVNCLVASNARFVVDEAGRDPAPRAPGPLRLGHLSNLCRDKGFFDVADLFDALQGQGSESELHLAGPIIGDDVRDRLDRLVEGGKGRVMYHGPLFGAEKRDFYRHMDLFLFPSNFDQEAAPSVVYESLAAGRPVLSKRRGCIPEMIHGDLGAVCEPSASFTDFAVRFLSSFDGGDEAVLERAKRIKAGMRSEAARSCEQYSVLMAMMGARDPSRIVQEY